MSVSRSSGLCASLVSDSQSPAFPSMQTEQLSRLPSRFRHKPQTPRYTRHICAPDRRCFAPQQPPPSPRNASASHATAGFDCALDLSEPFRRVWSLLCIYQGGWGAADDTDFLFPRPWISWLQEQVCGCIFAPAGPPPRSNAGSAACNIRDI